MTFADWMSTRVDASGDCWEWTKAINGRGYGSCWYQGRYWGAHRLVYSQLVGDPGSLHLHHLCRNKACVNPDHLAAMSQGDNNHQERRAFCKRGHPMNDATTWTRSNGRRICKRCNAVNLREWRARR